jgi:LuxR family maltose regulon positive regulatory protein
VTNAGVVSAKISIIRWMTTPIIATKLHLPSPPRVLVHRERLIKQLESGVSGKLILVSAPAGFGKTSLLSEWANCSPEGTHFSWLHLDQNDNQLVRFLSYLVAALQRIQGDLGEAALSGLQSNPAVPLENVLASLINEIDRLQQKVVLVLDDYQQIDTSAIHEAVSFLIDHLPAQMCLVIATRVDPPLPIHQWRARGHLTEIRAEQLRFNSEETRSYLEASLDTAFSAGDVTALGNRIEGWAAGLQMAALSLQGKKDVHQFIQSFSGSHRFIMDYLSEEIYNQQPARLQKFLLQTSILDRLSGPLCDTVINADATVQDDTGKDIPAQQTLEYLEHANLFLLSMDDERHWYRYHPLFGSLLRQRLRQNYAKEIPIYYQRASAWSESNGYPEDALRYALAANDISSAAQLVEQQALETLKIGMLATLSDWLDKLPEQIILERSWLSVYKSWVLLLTGKFENLERFLGAAETGEHEAKDDDELRGHILAIRAYFVAVGGQDEQAFEYANQALELLPGQDLTVRSVVIFVLGGINVVRGDIPRAIEAMLQAGETGEQAGNIHLAVSALSSAGDLLRSQGNLVRAKQTYDRAMKLGSGQSGRPLPIAAAVYSGLAEIYLELNDLEKARQTAETGLDLSAQWGNPESQIGCYLALAHVYYREGDAAEARTALDEARRLADSHSLTPGFDRRIAAYEELILRGRPERETLGSLIEPLTERELEVLNLMAKGRSNPEIAEELIIALGTVKAHSSSIYRKLDVRRRTEAVIKAGELGFLEK